MTDRQTDRRTDRQTAVIT